MTPHLLAGALLMLALAGIALALAHFAQGPDEAVQLRRAAEREAGRQEQDSHPVERGDWQPFRRDRPGRLRRPYTEAL